MEIPRPTGNILERYRDIVRLTTHHKQAQEVVNNKTDGTDFLKLRINVSVWTNSEFCITDITVMAIRKILE